MTDQDILQTLTQIARDLLGEDDITVSMETKGRDLPGWDSATYVNFIVAAEIEFGIKYALAEIESFQTFGEMVAGTRALLDRKKS